jgi:hypothetical protein
MSKDGGSFDGGGSMSAPGAWANQLGTGTHTLVPECDASGDCDIPSLDARTGF